MFYPAFAGANACTETTARGGALRNSILIPNFRTRKNTPHEKKGHLRQVAEVECVVALGRGRQQLARDSLVDLHRRRHQGLRQIVQGRNDRLQEAPEDRLEDPVEGAGRQGREPDHREMPEQTRGDLVPSASGGGARRQEDHVLDALEEQLLGVVEPAGVYRLPEKLVGGLGAVNLRVVVVRRCSTWKFHVVGMPWGCHGII